ncbi:MAG: alpha/beta hydrolase [Bacteroidetes bacterium]|nr:alpha/beta hydrolase [Bacteroidota bacterium]
MKNYFVDGLSVNDCMNGKSPLVFVHAFPLNSMMWNVQTEYFSKSFRTVSYDVRGLGRSRSEDNQFMMEMYINDLFTVIKNLDAGKVHAVGLSMGGYIIQGAVLKNPGLFKTITLADTKGDRDNDDALASRAASIRLLKSGNRKEFTDTFVKRLLNKNSYNSEIRIQVEKMVSENTDEGICGALLALATRYNHLSGLPGLDVPALVMTGSDDVLTPPSEAEKLSSALKNSQLKIIPDSGHMSNIENPSVFNSTLENFLKAHEGN